MQGNTGMACVHNYMVASMLSTSWQVCILCVWCTDRCNTPCNQQHCESACEIAMCSSRAVVHGSCSALAPGDRWQ